MARIRSKTEYKVCHEAVEGIEKEDFLTVKSIGVTLANVINLLDDSLAIENA